MSSAPDVVDPRQPADIRDQWKAESSITTNCMRLPVRERLIIADVSSSGDEFNLKVRKPYTITKQRERWTDDEHKKFLEALKLYGRAWRRIKEHIGTKTAVQIRSHAQKFFSKLERGVSSGDLAGKVEDIDFPPPRPKRKPSHPYPKKAGYNLSGEEVNRQPESIAYTPCINKRYSQLDAATISTHQNPLRTGHCFDVKMFDQTVIIPPVHKPVNPKRHLVKEDGISQLPNAQATMVNLCQNEGPSPFVRVQTNLTVLKESLPLHQNGKNSGITTVDAAEESVVEFSTNEVSAAEDSQSAFEGNFISKNCKDVNQAENCKVDSFDDNGSSMSSQLLKEDNPNNPMSVWIENLFRYYSGFLGPQYTAHGFPAKMVPTNPMACWPFMQASPMMNHPFHSAAMAQMVANWTGLVAGSQGSIPISSKEAHCLPSYADGRYFAPWLDQRGFKQNSSTNNSCEKEQASSANVYETPNMKNIKCTNEVIAQELQTKNLSDVAKDDDIEHGEKNGYLEDSDDNPPHGMETHEEENRLIEQSVNESDVGMDASDQAQHSLCTSIDEFEDGGKRSRDGSSSGSNTPLDGGNLSEAEMMPRYLETTIRDNDASSEKNHHQEADSGTERRCPKIRFKEIEKRKRHQQKDCKQGSLEDPKRIKGSAHDMDSWKEVSEEGRKAFRALFDNKNLPQTFPTVCDCQADNATIMDKQHVQRTLPCQNHATLMADDTVAAQTKGSQYSIITCEIPTRYVDDEGEVSGNTSLHHVQEDNDRKVVKFTVSPRSGFVPYRRPLL